MARRMLAAEVRALVNDWCSACVEVEKAAWNAGRGVLGSGAMPSPEPGMSRRALFGLGLERLRERAAAAPDLPPPPTLDEVRKRWAVQAATPSPLWRPVAERVVTLAALAPTDRVLAHGG